MKAVVAQQQIVVAHQWVSESAEAESRAQQARARLEVCDGDEPSAGEANTEGGRRDSLRPPSLVAATAISPGVSST